MNQLEFVPTTIAGLVVVQRTSIEDGRGFLSRLYSADAFRAAGVQKPISQINQTVTRRRGTVRGLHFQWPPHAEVKVVTCLRGTIFDVAVDLRRSSPTFLAWHGEVLSPENRRSLLIPEGFAHGFQTLTEDCELLYLHTAAYHQASEGGVRATDGRLAIAWPLEISEMSDRDRLHPVLTAAFDGIVTP